MPNSFIRLLLVLTLVGSLTSCKHQENNKNLANERLIVQLADSVDTDQLESAFAKYQLKVVKRLGARSSYYLCTFSPANVETDLVLAELKESKLVIEAQRDQQVSNRKNSNL